MINLSLELLQELRICPVEKDRAEIAALYDAAIERTSLSIADYISIKDIISQDSTCQNHREFHALLLCAFKSLREGSTCLPITTSSLQYHLAEIAPPSSLKNLTESIKKSILSGIWSLWIGHDNDDYCPFIFWGNALYFQRYFYYERILREKFIFLTKNNEKTHHTDRNRLKESLQNILVVDENTKKRVSLLPQTSFSLNCEQFLALFFTLVKDFVIISGGPGTGKTYVIAALLQSLAAYGIVKEKGKRYPSLQTERIRLAAPTGRAARRLTESIRKSFFITPGKSEDNTILASLEGYTIHRLLGYNFHTNSFRYNQYNHLPIDILIVDEVSMIDTTLMVHLLESISSGTKVIFLGDPHQLPSVEAGQVLADLIPEKNSNRISEELYSLLPKDFCSLFPQPATQREKVNNIGISKYVVELKYSYRSDRFLQNIATCIHSGNTTKMEAYMRKNRSKCLQPFLEIDNQKSKDKIPVNEISSSFSWIENNPDREREHRDAILFEWLKFQFLTPHFSNVPYATLVSHSFSFDQDHHSHGKIRQIFAYLEHAQIISITKHGMLGCEGINRYLAQELRQYTDRFSNYPMFRGAPVMMVYNDYARNLYNGDIGVILYGSTGKEKGYYAVFRLGAEFVSFPAELLPGLELAFAITVHKSQGSEYDHILFVLPSKIDHPLLTREIFYTALTRAKKKAILYGSNEVSMLAISSRFRRTSSTWT